MPESKLPIGSGRAESMRILEHHSTLPKILESDRIGSGSKKRPLKEGLLIHITFYLAHPIKSKLFVVLKISRSFCSFF
jgi:hypothetical protein